MAAGPSFVLTPILAVAGYLSLFHTSLDIVLLVGLCAVRSGALLQLVAWAREIPRLSSAVGLIAAPLLAFVAAQAYWTSPRPSKWTGPGKVVLFPCRTTHSRLFPEKHSFSYSYLAVGIPVGWEGIAGGLVSAGTTTTQQGGSWWFSLRSKWRKSWYDIDAGDYLARGRSSLGLRGKLDEFLKTQAVDPAEFPNAYLITAARFLGYHFNPVSFWYLYDANQSLSAMVLEVNNTFGERRAYFLRQPDPEPPIKGSPGSDPSHLPEEPPAPPARTIMKQAWPKDFHVSPFNSRKGSYSLAARNVLAPPGEGGAGPVDNTITLKSSKGHGKIVARLFSNGPAIDPDTLSTSQKLLFLASWWWVGFVTFPRIVKEAWVLFFRRKLHVWYRPEPLMESIGRQADSTEKRLEIVFRKYLRHLVETCGASLTVKYVSCGLPEDVEELISAAAPDDGGGEEPPPPHELEIKVLTPVFYQRFVRYAHDLEALFCEFRESSTIWVSRPDLLPKLVLKRHLPQLATSSYTDYAYFKAIQRLRRNPGRIERPLTSNDTPPEATKPREVDIRRFRISAMDGYVLAQEGVETRRPYRSAVLKLLLADRVSLGSVPLLEAQCFALQVWLAWVISRDAQSITRALSSLGGGYFSR